MLISQPCVVRYATVKLDSIGQYDLSVMHAVVEMNRVEAAQMVDLALTASQQSVLQTGLEQLKICHETATEMVRPMLEVGRANLELATRARASEMMVLRSEFEQVIPRHESAVPWNSSVLILLSHKVAICGGILA